MDLGAFKVGVADPKVGFAQALAGCHPFDVMGNCRSVIVYAFNIGLDYYTALDYEHNNIRLGHLYRDWTAMQLMTFLRKRGHEASEVPRELADRKNKIAYMSFKLAAYEAGIEAFGRPSIIITPECGPRANLGVVLTDVVLKPSGRMKCFDPCQACSVCVKACPVKAIGSAEQPPLGFDREKCARFVDWLKEETHDRVKLCGRCFNKCPAGKLVKKALKIEKWVTLDDLGTEKRRTLVNGFLES
jgi:epoxyqueuosine reductase QueG